MSDKSAEMVTGLVTRQGSNGRRMYSVAVKRALAELCRRPGVSVAAIALQHGVNANLLRRWVSEYCDVKPLGNAGGSARCGGFATGDHADPKFVAPFHRFGFLHRDCFCRRYRPRARCGGCARAGHRARLPGATGVIALPTGTQVWLAAGITDMRRGMHRLAATVQMVLLDNPHSGHVFVFRGRRGDLVKLLWWSGDGLCLFAKKLERGKFVWPQASSGTVCLTAAQLSMLLEGINWKRI